jgi:hypothetical protein
MGMPGFIESASLDSASGSYFSVAGGTSVIADSKVVAQIGLGDGSPIGGGRLGAWGCWSSWCCSCSYHMRCNPICHWDCCDVPCTRCIWPY